MDLGRNLVHGWRPVARRVRVWSVLHGSCWGGGMQKEKGVNWPVAGSKMESAIRILTSFRYRLKSPDQRGTSYLACWRLNRESVSDCGNAVWSEILPKRPPLKWAEETVAGFCDHVLSALLSCELVPCSSYRVPIICLFCSSVFVSIRPLTV